MSITGPPTPPHDPYEDIHISPIESDPQKEEQKQSKKEKTKSIAIFAHFLDRLEKIAAFFLRIEKENTKKHMITKRSIEEDIKNILKALEKLKNQDYSQDVIYLNKLSSCWHNFLEDAGKLRNNPNFFQDIESFIEKIHAYPKNEPHNLGYYLLEYAGAEWIPFPFMDMLQDLHLEHKKAPTTSHLTKWTRILRSLVQKISHDFA